jgi:hypothetical protein
MTVKHDFVSTLGVARPGCAMLFDDYTERKGYGVKRLLDSEIAPSLACGGVEIIDMAARDQTAYGEVVDHLMALVPGECVTEEWLSACYSPRERRRFRLSHLVWRNARRLALRARRYVG